MVGPFGVQGWVKLQPYTDEPEGLTQYPALLIGKPGEYKRRLVDQSQVHGRTVVCKLDGVHTREQAAFLRGGDVAVYRHELPENEPGEIYWTDLIGMAVLNKEGVALGTIREMVDNGAQCVMVVREEVPSPRERLIPFVPALVSEVSLQDRRVVVDWGADF